MVVFTQIPEDERWVMAYYVLRVQKPGSVLGKVKQVLRLERPLRWSQLSRPRRQCQVLQNGAPVGPLDGG